MKKRAIVAATVAVTTVALTLSACSSSGGSDPNAFEFWSFTGIGQKDSVAEYMADNPDIKIKLTEVGSSQETAQALTTALAGGKVPDLVLIQGDDMPKFLENAQNFVDLSTLGASDIRSDYMPAIFDQAVSPEGTIIGIPTDVGGLSMAYRADLFEAAGLPTEPDEVAALWTNWDDFIAVGKDYLAKTGKPFVDNVSTSIYMAAGNQVTEKYYSPDGELVYDTNPQVKAAFDLATEAYDAGLSANLAAFSSGWSTGRAQGAFAVEVAPSWMLSGIKTDAPDTAGDWRITTVPGIAGNWGGSYLAIPKRAANPQAAWAYIKQMQSPETQLAHFESSGSMPTTVAAYDSDAIKNYTDAFYGDSKIGVVLGDSVAAMNSFYIGPDSSTLGTAFTNALLDVESGNAPSSGAWDAAIANAKAALGG